MWQILVVVLIFASVLPILLAIQSAAILESHNSTLEFLKQNMQVGGTPIAVVREQNALQIRIAESEAEKLKELRAQRMASLGD